MTVEEHGSRCRCEECKTERERYQLRATVTATKLHREAIAKANGHAKVYGLVS